MSILSAMPDGFGFYYGFAKPDMRRVDVRREGGPWIAYVAGAQIGGAYATKSEAEAGAIGWLKVHPRPADVEG